MKLISIVILATIILVSCQPKANDVVEVGNPSIEGTVTQQTEKPIKLIESDKEWTSGNSKLEVRDEFDPMKEATRFEDLKVQKKELLTIEFEREPNRIDVYVLEQNNKKEKLVLEEAKIKMPDVDGYYVYELHAYWDEGIKNYAFDVEVE